MTAIPESHLKKDLSVLVIQVGNVSEVARSLMALKAVRHLYPQIQIHFVCRPDTQFAVKQVDWIQSVIVTPAVHPGHDDVLQTVALWVDKVIDQNFDILVNWTHDAKFQKLAALITSLLPSMVKLGNFLRDDGQLASYDGWAIYHQYWVQQGVDQDIHQTDLITTQLLTALQIHVGDPQPDPAANSVASRYFFKTHPDEELPAAWQSRPPRLRWIGLDPSAATQGLHSGWIQSFLRRFPDCGIVTWGDFGPSQDERWINLDRLDLQQAIPLFSRLQWLVTGQSAWLDLASLMNVRVLMISDSVNPIGQWTNIGPYGNGHVVVEGAAPEAVIGIWSYYQNESIQAEKLSLEVHFDRLGMASLLSGMQLFKSRIRAGAEGGGVTFDRVLPKALPFESWIYRVRGQMARAWFCGWMPPMDEEVRQFQLSPDLITRIRKLHESIGVLHPLIAQGKTTAIQLYRSSENLKQGSVMAIEDRQQIEDCGRKLRELEDLIHRVCAVEPELHALRLLYQGLMHNLIGTTLAQMAKESLRAFELIEEGLEIMGAYAVQTLKQARPKAVTISPSLQVVPLE